MAGKTRALQPIALIVLLAAGVMFAALFMPFVRQGCIFCPIAIPGSTFQLPTFSLMQGLDGWVVLCVVVAIFLEAAAYLRSRRRAAAIAALLLSGVALTLCVFEGIELGGARGGARRDGAAHPVRRADTQSSRVLDLWSLRFLRCGRGRCRRVVCRRPVLSPGSASTTGPDGGVDPHELTSKGRRRKASFRAWMLSPRTLDRRWTHQHLRCRRSFDGCCRPASSHSRSR